MATSPQSLTQHMSAMDPDSRWMPSARMVAPSAIRCVSVRHHTGSSLDSACPPEPPPIHPPPLPLAGRRLPCRARAMGKPPNPKFPSRHVGTSCVVSMHEWCVGAGVRCGLSGSRNPVQSVLLSRWNDTSACAFRPAVLNTHCSAGGRHPHLSVCACCLMRRGVQRRDRMHPLRRAACMCFTST